MGRDEDEKIVRGEIFPDDDGTASRRGMHVQMPPDVSDISLGAALLQQYRYWGIRRTIDAYRSAIESGVSALNLQTEFYSAMRTLDAEKARWEERDQYRAAARMEAQALIASVEADIVEAKVRKQRSEQELRNLEQQEAARAMLKEIEENNRAAELARAKRARQEEVKRLENAQNGNIDSGFAERRARLEQARKDYEELMAAKAEDIEHYGGETNLPDYLQTMYEKLEDELGFR